MTRQPAGRERRQPPPAGRIDPPEPTRTPTCVVAPSFPRGPPPCRELALRSGLGEDAAQLVLLLVGEVGLDEDHRLTLEGLFDLVDDGVGGQDEQRGGARLDLVTHLADEAVVDADIREAAREGADPRTDGQTEQRNEEDET